MFRCNQRWNIDPKAAGGILHQTLPPQLTVPGCVQAQGLPLLLPSRQQAAAVGSQAPVGQPGGEEAAPVVRLGCVAQRAHAGALGRGVPPPQERAPQQRPGRQP